MDEAGLRAVLQEHKPTRVVYSVGVSELEWSAAASLDSWHRVMMPNVWGFLLLMRELQFLGRDPRSVVAVSSDAARRPMRTSATYCASKAALNMTVRVCARELALEGWRVNAVAPGKVAKTPMTEAVDARVRELRGWDPAYAEAYELSSAPHGRYVTKEEVAGVVLEVLMSPVQSFTGQIVEVNGGR